MKGSKLIKRLARVAQRLVRRVVKESWRRDKRGLRAVGRTAASWAGFDPPPIPRQPRKPVATRYRAQPGRGRVHVEAHVRQTSHGPVKVAAHWRKK